MAGMIVMGLAMGVHEGVKKIQDKKEERKAKKAALVCHTCYTRLDRSVVYIGYGTDIETANGDTRLYTW